MIKNWLTTDENGLYTLDKKQIEAYISEPVSYTHLDVYKRQLLISIFGGLINGFCISLCLIGNTSTGGTDFIAIYFSEKNGRDIWNYILCGNAVILTVAGLLFGWDLSLIHIFPMWTLPFERAKSTH